MNWMSDKLQRVWAISKMDSAVAVRSALRCLVVATVLAPQFSQAALPVPLIGTIVQARMFSVIPALYYSRIDEVAAKDRGCQVQSIATAHLAALEKILASVKTEESPTKGKHRLDLRRILVLNFRNGNEVTIYMEGDGKSPMQTLGYLESVRPDALVPLNVPGSVQQGLDEWAKAASVVDTSNANQRAACDFFASRKQ